MPKLNPRSPSRLHPCHCFVRILLLLAVSGGPARASAPPRTPDEPQANLQIVPDLNADAKLDVAAMDKYETAVLKMLNNHRFAELDELAASLRKKKTRFAGGVWKLFIFYRGLKQPAGGYAAPDEDWESHLHNLATWAEQYPKSVTAWIALAEAYVEYAEKGRSYHQPGPAPGEKSIDQDPSAIAQDRMHQAKLALQEAEKLDAKCPHYYFVKMKINREPDAALLKEARTFEPNYYYYYRLQGLLLYLFSGEDDAALKFADQISAEIGGDEGRIAYYEIAATINGHGGNLPWPPAKFSWEEVQAGYAAMEERYGMSLFGKNQMAYIAIQLKDTLAARQFFAQIGDQWDPSTWGSKDYFENSRNWSMSASEFAAVLAIANTNGKTQSGQQYFQAARQQFGLNSGRVWQRCTQTLKAQLKGNLDLLLEVAGDGTVQRTEVWPQATINTCLATGIVSEKLKLPAPPAAPYWLRIPIVTQYRAYPSGQVKQD